MRKFLLCVVAAVCLLTSSFATTAVSGNLKDLITGSITSRTFVRFALANCGANQPRVNGTGLVAPNGGPGWYQDFTPDVNGAISGTIYSNTEITCGLSTNTWYYVSVWRDGKEGPRVPYLLSGVPFNLNTASPMSTNPSPVINPSYVLLNPSGDQTIVQPASTFLQVSGGFKVSSGALPITAATGGIGSVALPFANVTIGSGANQSATFSGSFTGNRTVNIPDANSNTVQTFTAPAHQFATAVSSAGVFTTTQPAFGDISGVATILQGGTGQTTGDYTAAFGAGPSYAGVSYATMASCNAALPATGGTCHIPSGWTEGPWVANLVISKPDVCFAFDGPASINMSTFSITKASANYGLCFVGQVEGHDGVQGVLFTYTGTSCAFCIGDAAADFQHLRVENIAIKMSGAGAAASAFTLKRVQVYELNNIRIGATTGQTAIILDGTGSFSGDNILRSLNINGAAICIQFLNQANNNTVLNVSCPNTSAAGKALDFENANGNIVIGADIENAPTAVFFANNVNVWGNYVWAYLGGNTTDFSFGAASFQNTTYVTGGLPAGADPVVSDSGTNNSVWNPRKFKIDKAGNLTVGGQLASTVATGTAPLSVASTTNVPNLNASTLNGATFAAPGAIGGTTPASGIFSTLATGNAGGGSGSVASPELACNEGTAPATAVNYEIIYCDSTLHRPMLSNNNGSFFALPQKIASGTATMTTGAIGAGACGTTVTVAATGVATTDVIEIADNAAVAANPGVLIVNKWPTAGNVNFNYCNPTAGSVTPTAATLNWGVVR